MDESTATADQRVQEVKRVPPRAQAGQQKSVTREYAEALIVALLLAFFIRSFIVQAFKIPSGSMLPTLQIGDHILVSKFSTVYDYPIHWRRPCGSGVNLIEGTSLSLSIHVTAVRTLLSAWWQ